MARKILLEIIRFLLIFLFVYASVIKLIDYHKFVVQVGLSPLLPSPLHTVAWVIPVSELLIAIALLLPSLLKTGLYASLVVMMLFTLYIIGIFTVADHVPCSCGGILENLSWTEHLIFNIGFVLLILWGLRLVKSEGVMFNK
jgi:uncharacterized membrane protein YphA (DoxX/SURF4 family)